MSEKQRNEPPVKLTRAEKREIQAIIRKYKGDGKAHSAQASIPYQSMYPDGICKVTANTFSKCIEFADISYQLAQADTKTAIFENLCDLYNYLDASIHVQLSFVNRKTDPKQYAKSFEIKAQGDDFDDIRAEYSGILQDQLVRGNNGLTKRKFLTFTIEADNLKMARARLTRIETDLLGYFKTMGAVAHVLDAKERLVDLIFFICSLIYLASSFIISWKEKSPEHRYKGANLFFFGQITSKLNTTSKTMTLICVTLVLAIFLFIAAPILTGWASGYLDIRSMYDVQIFSRYNDVYDEENLPGDDYEIVTDYLVVHGIETDYDCTFSLYLPKKEDFHNRVKYDFPVAAISLSDYNRIRKMLGYEPVALSENEFTTQWKAIATEEERNRFLAEHTSVMTDAGELTLSGQPYYEEAIGETAYNSYTDVLYVFPDSVCEKLLSVMRNRYITTSENISYESACELEQAFSDEYPEITDIGVSYGIRLSTLQVNGTKANNFVLQASMLYGAVVLMVICLTILSLQQLLDAGKYKYRFSVLRKLGVEEQQIGKLVLKQLGVWFGLPILVAIIVSMVVIAYFIQTVSAEISAYIGSRALMLQIGINDTEWEHHRLPSRWEVNLPCPSFYFAVSMICTS